MKIKNIKKKAIIFALSLAEVIALTGCADDVDCDISGDHVHLYLSEDGIKQYSQEEKSYIDGVFGRAYYRTDDYKKISSLEDKYYKFINKKNYINIDYNYNVLNDLYPKLDSYMEYQYRYQEAVYHHTYDSDGNISSTYITYVTNYAWTRNENHINLTGRTRVMDYAYHGYKVYYDEAKRKYKSIESGYYETIDDLIDAGYNYCITSNFESEVDNNMVNHSKTLKLN